MESPMNREAWLAALTERLRPKFQALGAPLPDIIHVSVGFPSTRALSRKKQRIGECWMPAAGKDGSHQIFISPLISDVIEVGATLVHELAHAALPDDTRHKGPFARLARQLGLEGKATATTAGEELKAELAKHIEVIGPYPHAGLSASTRPIKKQSTRLLKAICSKCGYTVRVTSKWLDIGPPICPIDNIPMTAEGSDDGEEEEA
jgi:hypothetical protein